ncbi:natural resistance-associated macrophage protein-domain-containing protein [Podospora australis]|uniref:Natural resistance-associated macrophage protein-domain-containing protein n=1 Tax=Podospora australis TaxID=1536484 RepID=A0AAN7AKR8_9PEZI|nr:natural resistance-associated macrophage protein-domain-containing protein [Podospora australis]
MADPSTREAPPRSPEAYPTRLEKKDIIHTGISPSLPNEPCQKSWLSSFKTWPGLAPQNISRPHIYQSRSPPPPEPNSLKAKIWRFFKFLGLGAIISSLCVKLGTVTGLDLAQLNHRHLPRWVELAIYLVAEASIMSTGLGQVIGQAIALNILIPSLPLPGACVLSVFDTLLILLFYSPSGELRRIRAFGVFVSILVAAVFVTLCVALSMVSAPAGPIFRGFLPSKEVFVSTGLYEMCAILGGTLMPHALYVGTALSRSLLYDFDARQGNPSVSPDTVLANSALVIIAGSAFYHSDDEAVVQDLDRRSDEEGISTDLYDLHSLFSSSISPAAATLFAVSLLFSGVSAGIVSTMAGQIVMEGALNIRLSPFLRRLLTRCVAIIPALVIALAVGKEGLSKALVACNYLLAIALIPITFPLVWYTGRTKCMQVFSSEGGSETRVNVRNGTVVAGIAWLLWMLVVVMDVATVVLVGLGVTEGDG